MGTAPLGTCAAVEVGRRRAPRAAPHLWTSRPGSLRRPDRNVGVPEAVRSDCVGLQRCDGLRRSPGADGGRSVPGRAPARCCVVVRSPFALRDGALDLGGAGSLFVEAFLLAPGRGARGHRLWRSALDRRHRPAPGRDEARAAVQRRAPVRDTDHFRRDALARRAREARGSPVGRAVRAPRLATPQQSGSVRSGQGTAREASGRSARPGRSPLGVAVGDRPGASDGRAIGDRSLSGECAELHPAPHAADVLDLQPQSRIVGALGASGRPGRSSSSSPWTRSTTGT